MYSCYIFDLDDSYLESWGNRGVSFEFVRGKCLYCGLRGAACMGEGCGFCGIGFCV